MSVRIVYDRALDLLVLNVPDDFAADHAVSAVERVDKNMRYFLFAAVQVNISSASDTRTTRQLKTFLTQLSLRSFSRIGVVTDSQWHLVLQREMRKVLHLDNAPHFFSTENEARHWLLGGQLRADTDCVEEVLRIVGCERLRHSDPKNAPAKPLV